MTPEIIIHANSLSRFPCAEWDTWISSMLDAGSALLAFDAGESEARGAAYACLSSRFPGSVLDVSVSNDDGNQACAAGLWFGDERPADGFFGQKQSRVVALRAHTMTRAVVARALKSGATHFLTDALPDELDHDFSDPVFREWLRCFVFVPPCAAGGNIKSSPQHVRRVVVCDEDSVSPPDPDDPVEATRCLVREWSIDFVPTGEIERSTDETLANGLLRGGAVFLATRSRQVAHRVQMAAGEGRFFLEHVREPPFSPLRFCLPSAFSSRAEPSAGHGGPLRSAGSRLLRFLHGNGAERSSNCEGNELGPLLMGADETAHHLLCRFGIRHDRGSPGKVSAFWSAGEYWNRWAELESGPEGVKSRSRNRQPKWMDRPGSAPLIAALVHCWQSPAAGRLWVECFVVERRSAFGPDLYDFVRHFPKWHELCDEVFAWYRAIEPDLEDLRGPMTMVFTELCSRDPENGDRFGVPERVVGWLDADAGEERQSSEYLFQRALAHARWRDFAHAFDLAAEYERRVPESRGTLAHLFFARIEAFREAHYIEDERRALMPVLQELRRVIVDTLAKDGDVLEMQKAACFAEIHVGDARAALRRLSEGCARRPWPPAVVGEVSLELLSFGCRDEGRKAAMLLWNKADELELPYHLAFSAGTLALAGYGQESVSLYERLSRQAPDFFDHTEPFALRLRSLVLAIEGKCEEARVLFERAVSSRPALDASRRVLDTILSRICPRSTFSFRREHQDESSRD